MIVSNRSFFKFWRSVLVTSLIVLILDQVLALLPGSLFYIFTTHYLSYFTGALIFILAVFRFSYLSYEDEYEIIHIRTQSLVFGPFQEFKHQHYEFPKNILVQWEVKKGFIKKELVLTVNSSSGRLKTRRFDLFFLKKQDQEYIFNSLSKLCDEKK